MKKMLRNAVLAAVAFAFGSSAFADVEFTAYNKLSTDTLVINHTDKKYNDGKDDDDTFFPGFTNRVYAEILTEKVDAMVEADVSINKTDAYDKDGDDVDDWSFQWDGLVKDWYVEVRPNEIITLGFHDGIFADGSTLPIYDDNVSAGNIGSDGFTFVVRPTWKEGFLRLAATVPFTDEDANWFYAKDTDYTVDEEGNTSAVTEDDTFNFGLGAIADFELAQIGVSVQDVADSDERTFGVYVNFPGLFGANENMTLGCGFAHSEDAVGVDDLMSIIGEDAGLAGDNVGNAYFTFEGEKCGVTAEVMTNFGEDSTYDFYGAAAVSFGLSEKFSLTVTGRTLIDTKDEDEKLEPAVGGALTLDYALTEHNELEAEIDVDTCDDCYTVKFPVYWKYTF